MAAILEAILNISISPIMPTFCADYFFFGLHPKSLFGNQTNTCCWKADHEILMHDGEAGVH